jgi:hypothetical protein
MRVTVAIVFFILLGLASATGESLLNFEVPIPPAGRLIETKPYMIADKETLCAVIYSPKTIEEVRAYYDEALTQKGFKPTEDQYDKLLKQQEMAFKKDDLIVSIAIWDKGGGVTGISVVKYLQPPGAPDMEASINKALKEKLVLKKMPSPAEDMPGKDLAFIPRPPAGVRWFSFKLKNNEQLLYFTPEKQRIFTFRKWRVRAGR